MEEWEVIKDLHNSMVIDFKKKTLRCGKGAWFKFETKDRIFIFMLDKANKMSGDPITESAVVLT